MRARRRPGTRAPPPAPPGRAARAPAPARASSPSSAASRAAAANAYGSDLQARVHDAPEARRAGGRKPGTLYDMAPATSPPASSSASRRRHEAAQLDDAAVAALRDLYSDLGIDGRVLDLGGCVGGPLRRPARRAGRVRRRPRRALPYGDDAFDDVLCSARVGALTRPRETFAEVARVLRPGGRFVCTFAGTLHVPGEVRGWVATDDAGRVRIVRAYFALRRAPSARPRATCGRRSPARATASGRSGRRSAPLTRTLALQAVTLVMLGRWRPAAPRAGARRATSRGRCRSAVPGIASRPVSRSVSFCPGIEPEVDDASRR